MKLDDFVQQQIQYLASPFSDLPQSIAAFGITPKRFEELFAKSDALFQKIKSILEKNRQRELVNLRDERSRYTVPMQDERNEVDSKYQNLINNYKDRPELLTAIVEWKSEALFNYNNYFANQEKYISQIPTPLKERAENFELVDFNLREIRKARKRMNEISDEYGIISEESLNGMPSEIREEFECVSNYNWKLFVARYVFVHELEGLDDGNLPLEYVLNGFSSNSGLNFINWGVVCFEQNHKYWASKASAELNEIVYTNFAIFDDVASLTPIENS